MVTIEFDVTTEPATLPALHPLHLNSSGSPVHLYYVTSCGSNSLPLWKCCFAPSLCLSPIATVLLEVGDQSHRGGSDPIST